MAEVRTQLRQTERVAANAAPALMKTQTPPLLVAGLLVGAVLAVALYTPVLVWMVRTWARDAYYGHAFFIPLVVAFLVWAKRGRLARIRLDGHPAGCALLAGGLLVYAGGIWLDVHFVSAVSLVAVLGGAVLWIWGTKAARELLFPLAFLLFMVPLGRLLSDAFSNPLQRASTQLTSHALGLLGLHAQTHGASIEVPGYTFVVGQPCSGLKSIIAMTALAALLAYLLEGPLWKRFIVFAAATPTAVAANVVRITIVVLVGKSFGAEAAESLFHGVSGIIVFVVGLGALMGIGRVLGCRRIRGEF